MATTAPIVLPIQTPGLAKLKKLERQMEAIERDVAALNRGLPRASNNIRGLGNAARRASSGFAVLNKAMIKVAAVIAAVQGATFVFTSAAELETQAKSLEILTGSAKKAAEVIGELQEFSAVTPFTSSELIDTSKRLKAFGVDTEKLVATTKRLADVSGATGAKINEVALAYGQVQAKGKLQTEELYQLQERGIGIAEELKRMYGLTGEEFVKALEKGQISAEAVEQAFINLTGTSGKYFNGATAQSETLAGKWSTLIDAVTRLAQNLGQTLGPALKGILTLAINITNAIVGMIQKINQLLGIGTENAISKLERDIASLEDRLGTNGGRRDAIMNSQIAKKKAELALLRAELEKTADVTKKIDTNLFKLTGGDDSGSGSGSGSSKTSELEKQREELERQFKAGEEIKQNLERQMQMLAASTDLEKERLQITHELEDTIARIMETAAPAQQEGLIMSAEELARIKEAQAILNDQKKKKENDDPGKIEQYIKQLETDLADFEGMVVSLAQTIESELAGAMSNAITGIIDGTQTAEEAFANMFKNIGKAFIDMATQMIAKALVMKALGILGGGGGGGGGGGLNIDLVGRYMAEGGFVTGPTNAVMGESGEPEYAIPASKMSGAMERYNAGMRGSAVVDGANSSGDPGLGPMDSSPLQVNITGGVMQFGGQEYLRKDQLPSIIAQASKAGETQTLRRLRMSQSTRQKTGI